MKKGVKITIGVLILLIVILLVLPFAFEGKVSGVIKKQINNALQAKVDFNNMNLSFFRNFPDATASLENISVIGTGAFENDTLLIASKVSVTINLKSFFGESGYEVKKVEFHTPVVKAKVNADGLANWNIVRQDKDVSAMQNSVKESSPVKLKLDNIEMKDASVFYTDIPGRTSAELLHWNGTLSGDMGADVATLKTHSEIASLSYLSGKIPLLNKARLEADMTITSDMKEKKFTFEKNTIRLNAIETSLDGWISVPDTSTIAMDIQLNTSKVEFKELLSLIPVIYAKDFASLQTSGNITFEAKAKGMLKGENYPSFDVKLLVDNGMFRYPSLPQAVTGIMINSHIYNAGGSLDNTVTDIPVFHFNLGGNPFDMAARITTPVSDPDMSAELKGKINLAMIKEVYPLEKGTDLNGEIDANLQLNGRLSYLDKGLYDKFNAKGKLLLHGMNYKSSGLPPVYIEDATMNFNSRFVELMAFSMKIGESDLQATGKLERYLEYFLKGGTLKGSLALSSSYLNLNEFMSATDTTSVLSQPDTTKQGILLIPENLDINLMAQAGKVLFQRLDMRNVRGALSVKSGRVTMQNLSADALGGAITVSGYYETVNKKEPVVNMTLNTKNVSFAQSFHTLQLARSAAPVFENMEGTYSLNLHFTALLNQQMEPIMTSVNGAGLLQSNNVKIGNVKALDALAKALQNESFKTMSPKDLSIPFEIKEGRLFTSPFDLSYNGATVTLSGSTGIDQTIDYNVKVALPPAMAKGGIQNLKGTIRGTFSSPKVSLDVADAAKQAAAGLLDKLLGGKKDTAGKDTTNTKSEVDDLKAKALDLFKKLKK